MRNRQGEDAWWRPDASGPALVDMTLGALLDEQAERYGARPAVHVDERGGARGTSWTYAELRQEADLIARGLMAQGIRAGERVAVMAPNSAEWILLEYALAKIGAVLVTVNPALLQEELAYILTQGRVAALVFAPRLRSNDITGHLLGTLPELATTRGCVRAAGGPLPDLRLLIGLGETPAEFALPFDALREAAKAVSPGALSERQAGVACTDVAQIQYTSGTTGKPKGAMLSHRSTLNNARLMADRGGFRAGDTLLSAMPLFHTAGCVCNVMAMLACGGRVVTMDTFDAERMLELWQAHRPTIINAVPTMMTRLLEHPDAGAYDIRTLRTVFTGGTTIPPSLMHSMRERTGGEPMIIMGMTECSPIITQTNPVDDTEARFGTAGTPLPHTEIRIVDPESGRTCGWGESGELCIRGYLTMVGYFDMPEKTAETIDADGWLHSGDLAELAESGHLRIVGRLKDMIIRGGENVYPAEIENCLLDHDAVSEVQVIGVPDADLGEEICAFVVPAPGAEADPAALQDFCRARMARHKMPKYIVPIAALPLTANGKVQKFVLRETATGRIADGSLQPVRQ
ncbi:AMP-binding protein [Vannielia litorea]|uniref:AMP-binding protein n=1 Tax=Vannielia litorea TaxID=1217970 RepID=UPI001C94020D|nr:AMP-binding protein [Vannielia litorea]MBY6154378.1 AMP-binding protein [Vannielia litorea]